MAFDLNRVKARRAQRKETQNLPPAQERIRTVRCVVNPDDGHNPFEAEFVVIPRVGGLIDTRLQYENSRQQLRVTGVVHFVRRQPSTRCLRTCPWSSPLTPQIPTDVHKLADILTLLNLRGCCPPRCRTKRTTWRAYIRWP
jgi:hypothetical protein